jgi:hypothetical protein
LSVAAWFCSPEAEIQKDVLENGTGQDRQAIDGVIAKIFYPIRREDLALKIQAFWKEFDDIQSASGEIYNGLSDPFLLVLVETAPHRWHKIWMQPYTSVFGYVACQVTSKPLNCGGAERTWGAFKHLKNGKQAHMSGENQNVKLQSMRRRVLSSLGRCKLVRKGMGWYWNLGGWRVTLHMGRVFCMI